MKYLGLLIIFSFLFLAAHGGAFAVPKEALAGHEHLSIEEFERPQCVLGVVPQFSARQLVSVWGPIAEKLSSRTSCEFVLCKCKNIKEFEKNFQQGLFTVAYMNPIHAVNAYLTQGYEPIINSRDKKLEGILVVRKDSGINDVTELNNKKIAFPSPNAFGASLLLKAELKRKYDIDLELVYVKSHNSVYLHVYKDLVKGGGGVVSTYEQQSEAVEEGLKILYKTIASPPHPLVIHPSVTDELRDEIMEAMFSLAEEKPELISKIPMNNPVETNIEEYMFLTAIGVADFYVDHDKNGDK